VVQIVLLTVTDAGQSASERPLPTGLDSLAVERQGVTTTGVSDALTQLWQGPFAIILVEGAIAASELLTPLKHLTQGASPQSPQVILLGDNDASLAVQAIKAGASDYWVRDRITPDQIKQALGVDSTQKKSAATSVKPIPPTEQTSDELTAQQIRKRFELVTETIQDVFWISDFRTAKILYVSPAYREIWGRSPDEVYQDYALWAETIHPDDRDRVVSVAAQTTHQDTVEQEYRIVRPDGSVRWIRDRGFAVRGPDGEVKQTVGVAQDITERKQAAIALAENEARLQGFVESNVVGMLYGDIHGSIVDANDELLRMVGYSREDLGAGRLNWIAMTPPEYLPLDERKCAEAKLNGACAPFEKEYIRKDGKRVPILIGFSLLGERREQSVCFVLDLTAQKKAERAYRRSEDRLRMAMESAQLGTFDWNLTKDKLIWDKRCKAMFGLSPTVPVTIDIFFAALHPDDHAYLNHQLDRCLDPAGDGVYKAEYRAIGIEDQVERWILARGQVYFTPEGTPKRLVGTVLDITERKQAETALRESQERLQLAIDGSGSGFWDWNIVTNEDYLSPEWLKMLGFEAGELPDKYSSWEKLIHPDDKPRVMETLYTHLQNSQHPYQFEYRLRTKSEDWKWIVNYGRVVKRDAAGKPVRMAGIHLDISDRKQAEEQVRLSEARYRTLANAVSQLMWMSQADGQVEFFNQHWYAYTGLQDVDLASGHWPQVIHPDDLDTILEVRTTAIARQVAYEVEARVKRHDQVYRWYLVRVVPLVDDATGQVINWLGTATDIHDRKQVEVEREQLLAQAQAARTAAEQANRMKDEFLAILSHELRSPLNPILGWSQLLQTKEFDRPRTLQALATIERNAKLQVQLVDDLLDVAKILRGKLKLNHAAVDLAAMINAALETMQTAAIAKSITVETRLQSAQTVWGDEGRLQQIVWNLLSNAIKFTPEEGQITVSLTSTGTATSIAVTDTGKGIQPEFLPHIFESFRQEDISITRSYGGLGLGLAIARYLTEAHGGTIAAESPGLGQGATFTVTLPLMANPADTPHNHGLMLNTPSLAGVQILAVDDDADCRELIDSVLSVYGAEVLTAGSAQEALKHFHKFEPDVLISDLGMPQLDGYSLLRQIRTLSVNGRELIPAIALTAYSREEDFEKSLAAGFQRHVTKPIEIDILIRTITELIHPRAKLGHQP
jgi:PAS domain S-box-containing protein